MRSDLSPGLRDELLSITKSICGDAGSRGGKGILAADETPTAMDDRFSKIGLENTKEVTDIFEKYGCKQSLHIQPNETESRQ